ncbi:MAG: Rrf2 family transcriptional regulator [Planctomycetota bacterium]|nr:Rrf2 family transcriptional regulator [Planctomycetota bacterium]
MISQTAEYALRAVVCLVGSRQAPMTTQEISQMAKIPAGYLSKVMQALVRAGLVNSFRGLGGGFLLAKEPRELSVYEIIQAVDPLKRIRSCPLELRSHGAQLCALHRRLDDAMAMVEKGFRESTIAELLWAPTKSKPLCDVGLRGKHEVRNMGQ